MEKEVKIPKWLQYREGVTIARRPQLDIDDVEEDGTARDTSRPRPPHRWKVKKRTEKRLKEMEALRDWGEKKGKLTSESIKECMGNS